MQDRTIRTIEQIRQSNEETLRRFDEAIEGRKKVLIQYQTLNQSSSPNS